jgi:hypothetical protein
MIGAVCTTVLFAISAFARDRTMLNGTWTLVPTQSSFNGQPVIQTGTVTINERQGDITVSRNFAYDGANNTYFYRDTVDSENGATIHTGRDVKSKARWDKDVLRVTTTESGAVTSETYQLLPDGTMKATVVRPGNQIINMVFVRK